MFSKIMCVLLVSAASLWFLPPVGFSCLLQRPVPAASCWCVLARPGACGCVLLPPAGSPACCWFLWLSVAFCGGLPVSTAVCFYCFLSILPNNPNNPTNPNNLNNLNNPKFPKFLKFRRFPQVAVAWGLIGIDISSR